MSAKAGGTCCYNIINHNASGHFNEASTWSFYFVLSLLSFYSFIFTLISSQLVPFCSSFTVYTRFNIHGLFHFLQFTVQIWIWICLDKFNRSDAPDDSPAALQCSVIILIIEGCETWDIRQSVLNENQTVWRRAGCRNGTKINWSDDTSGWKSITAFHVNDWTSSLPQSELLDADCSVLTPTSGRHDGQVPTTGPNITNQPSKQSVQDTDPHQCLVQAGRRPVIRCGVESWVFSWHHRVGHDHTVSLVHAQATASFDLGCQMGAGRVCEQASHSLVIVVVTSRSVVRRAAATGCTGLSAQRRGEEEEERTHSCHECRTNWKSPGLHPTLTLVSFTHLKTKSCTSKNVAGIQSSCRHIRDTERLSGSQTSEETQEEGTHQPAHS